MQPAIVTAASTDGKLKTRHCASAIAQEGDDVPLRFMGIGFSASGMISIKPLDSKMVNYSSVVL